MIKEGTEGACLFHKAQGQAFIIDSGYDNMELVHMLEILENDGTLN